MSIAALLQSKISTDKEDTSDIKNILDKKKQELQEQEKKAAKSERHKEIQKNGQLKYLRKKQKQGYKQCLVFIEERFVDKIDSEIKSSKKVKKPTRSDLINKLLEEKYGNEIQ